MCFKHHFDNEPVNLELIDNNNNNNNIIDKLFVI